MYSTDFWQLLALMIGGGAGASLRYACGLALKNRTSFPLATLAVNVIGSALAGALLALTLREVVAPALRDPLADGLLGGLTTFSTLALETFALMERSLWFKALLNALANAGLGLLAACAGFVLLGGL